MLFRRWIMGVDHGTYFRRPPQHFENISSWWDPDALLEIWHGGPVSDTIEMEMG